MFPLIFFWNQETGSFLYYIKKGTELNCDEVDLLGYIILFISNSQEKLSFISSGNYARCLAKKKTRAHIHTHTHRQKKENKI